MSEKQAPRLPAGRESSMLSTISQSLSFYSSPHLFLTSRQDDPDNPPENSVPLAVRARILNRDIAVIVSYTHCKEILDIQQLSSLPRSAESAIVAAHAGQTVTPTSFGVLPAYKELMVDFFPHPNLLLSDAPSHKPRREAWDEHMAKVNAKSSTLLREIVEEEVSTWPAGGDFDLYDHMKDMTWRLLVAVFLELKPEDSHYHDVVKWQEELLRGQFSLFPVSIKSPFWRSPRSRGLEARRKLQEALRRRVDAIGPQCPFHCQDSKVPQEELASNLLLFTSSIAVKAVASLLTASLLNLYLFPSETSLIQRVRDLENSEDREILMRSILLETERLSPPVIGLMRRMQQDIVLQRPGEVETPGTLVPSGWDAWLYFFGANRNEHIYTDAHRFVAERFIGQGTPPSLTFGFGDKECLGKDMVRQIVQIVATVLVDSGIDLRGSVESEGVRGWLGWDVGVSLESIERDLKQLPCQRPRKPIKLYVSRSC
ncbi:hypothetical protein N7539_004459 [Penicillium diatomitis]|uniref:Cytochrome P450 n=1 Tax=Penicillium diatomitis TaxID=2819901 RepID=A0A9X0BYH5_9EURO|nr:uncharacterized protein N7539_004459 [Penicillium diatomitis]KAJ5489569.1 hypothetical protein N7539_004459 [Penicillium diatomitis]